VAWGLTPSLLTTWTDQVSFGHLIRGVNTDGGYVIASRVSVDFPESDLLQFYCRYQLLFVRVLRFHVIAAQQLVATLSLRVSEGVEQPAYIKGSDPQWLPRRRGQSDPPAATSRERDVRSRLGALQR
jgi:hypothetical protein